MVVVIMGYASQIFLCWDHQVTGILNSGLIVWIYNCRWVTWLRDSLNLSRPIQQAVHGAVLRFLIHLAPCSKVEALEPSLLASLALQIVFLFLGQETFHPRFLGEADILIQFIVSHTATVRGKCGDVILCSARRLSLRANPDPGLGSRLTAVRSESLSGAM